MPYNIRASRGREADNLLFPSDRERAFCRRQQAFLNVFLGAGYEVAAASQVELALDIFAVALNRLYTETEGMGDLSIAKP